MVDKIDTHNNISRYKENDQDFGIKNYFLEAQKKAAGAGQNVKKKFPPIFDFGNPQNALVPNSFGSSFKTCTDN